MNSSQGPEQPNLASGIRIGSQVSILGEQGSYLVTNIDMQRYMVDLIPIKGGAAVRGVHVSAVALACDHLTTMRARTLIARYSGS
jgi:hypothetical protein